MFFLYNAIFNKYIVYVKQIKYNIKGPYSKSKFNEQTFNLNT